MITEYSGNLPTGLKVLEGIHSRTDSDNLPEGREVLERLKSGRSTEERSGEKTVLNGIRKLADAPDVSSDNGQELEVE